MQDTGEDLDMPPSNPLDMFILSHDALLGTRTDQTIPPAKGWSDRPSKNTGVLSGRLASDERDRLLTMLRRGVPPALRCAVWVTNVVWAVDPQKTKQEADEYGTLKKVAVLEHGWKIALKQIFPDDTDEADAPTPDFGLGDASLVNLLLRDHGSGSPIPEKGAAALKRVLYAAQQSLGIEYCPMLPDITAFFLTTMEESYAYATIREMLEDSSHFIALSRVEHVAWCKTFADLMKRIYPQTHAVLTEIGVLTKANALDPIFKRMFVTVLRRKHVLRIMDLFTLDGVEVIFRFGTALMCLYHAHMTVHDQFNITDATSWWDGVRNFCHSKRFHFEVFLQDQVYGFTTGRFGMRYSIFPRRDLVERLIENNEDWARENLTAYHDAEAYEERPLGFVEMENIPTVLARHAPERQKLAEWLPTTLKSTKLEIIYSSNVHGRTIERFYHHCAQARHTITLFEVLGRDTTVGMFATQTWHKNSRGYGNGECFIFRLRPNPACFKWKQQQQSLSSSLSLSQSGGGAAAAAAVDTIGSYSFDSSSSGGDHVVETRPPDQPPTKQAQRQFADQVMISDDHFISMGIGKDGASGLRLNEDLTRGSTSPAMGFGNESVLADDTQVFDVGLVEVYRLVREVDGKPVDSI